MPAERAGYTATVFCVDVCPSMGQMRVVELPEDHNGEVKSIEMTHLEWALQFVKLKMQEMIYNGRKTDQCGVILFGSDRTKNIINDRDGSYEHVEEFIPIAQASAATLAKLDTLRPSSSFGDPIDAIIVALETQQRHLANKRTWTRKLVVLTDGESPIELEDWNAVVAKVDEYGVDVTVVGVDFNDEEIGFKEEIKSKHKEENELFYADFTRAITDTGRQAIVGTLSHALDELAKPELKQTKSVLQGNVLRIGSTALDPEHSLEIHVKISKATALARPKSWKRFSVREKKDEDGSQSQPQTSQRIAATPHPQPQAPAMKIEIEGSDTEPESDEEAAPVNVKREPVSPAKVKPESKGKGMTVKKEEEEEAEEEGETDIWAELLGTLEKEELVRGFKYGASYVACTEGQFQKLETTKGLDICAFFEQKNFRREYALGEISYVWADPNSPAEQVALSALRKPKKFRYCAVARLVTADGRDPRMGVLWPMRLEGVDCLLWAPMPFADDVRKYAFSPLQHLLNRKGEVVTTHPFIPTDEQQDAMDAFVDAMDLGDAGPKNNLDEREPWFDPSLSYNPAIHRTKQALFHAAVVSDLTISPIPPPHPELTKYFDPPRRALKRAREPLEEAKKAFGVKEVPKKARRARKDEHVHANDEGEDEELLIANAPVAPSTFAPKPVSRSRSQAASQSQRRTKHDSDIDEEADEDFEMIDMREGEEGKSEGSGSGLATPPPDPQRPSGRLIGLANPAADLRANLARGDVVTKAVSDTFHAILTILRKPFASRRTDELKSLLRELREACLTEDEIEAWNAFCFNVKQACVEEDGGCRAFWENFVNIAALTAVDRFIYIPEYLFPSHIARK
ncbi:SPOC domain-like protein [Peniophora sp. CONT]|nr:SPOC domain-like protein [Peniophora sp. CONT]